jgi:hypothetical protein
MYDVIMKTKLESDALHTVDHDSIVLISYQGEMFSSHHTLLRWMENRAIQCRKRLIFCRCEREGEGSKYFDGENIGRISVFCDIMIQREQECTVYANKK